MALDDEIRLSIDSIRLRNRAFDFMRKQCEKDGHRDAECYDTDEVAQVNYMYCAKCYSTFEEKYRT